MISLGKKRRGEITGGVFQKYPCPFSKYPL